MDFFEDSLGVFKGDGDRSITMGDVCQSEVGWHVLCSHMNAGSAGKKPECQLRVR